ncbi:hypothetical protein ACVW0J_006244 [Bradyrhizobium sp. i1.7.7]
MNFHERAETNEQQAASQGDAVSQIDTTEKLSGTPETESSLFRTVRAWRRRDRNAGLDLRPRLDRLAPGRLAVVLKSKRRRHADARKSGSGRNFAEIVLPT